jgi:RHS repeat-associated protein
MMPETQTLGRKRIRVISLFSMLGLLTTALVVWAGTELSKKIIAERQAALVAVLRKNVVDSPAFLVEHLRELQSKNIFLFVPGMKKPVSFSVGLFSFDPKAFPESFLSGLVYEIEHGSPVYHVKVREVRETREIEILNADGKVFYVFEPSSDYDPRWLALQKKPQLYEAALPAGILAQDEEWLDPSHVEMEIALIPANYVEVYAEGRFASLYDVLLAEESTTVQKTSLSGGMQMMMRSSLADSNIVLAAPVNTSSGMLLEIQYPATFTNRLELFVMTNLLDFCWSLLATNLSTAGTNTVTWLDAGATNSAVSNQFYAAGNADVDTDGDGIVDGRELLMYRSDPNSVDSDGDGYLDIYEIKRGSDPSRSSSIPAPTHIVTNGVSTIQAMINSVTQDYAVVQVKAGTYSGAGNMNLDFGGKKLMLVSESGASNTVIDCQYAGRGFNFHSGEALFSIVKGLTVTKGLAASGAAIMVSNASPWIMECNIVSNRAAYATSGQGAVVLINSHAKLTACRVEGNGLGEYGGIYGDWVDYGGGVYILGGAPWISNSIISGNTAGYDGGGIWMMNSTGIVAACDIESNSAVYSQGGGIWVTGQLTMVNNRVLGNIAGQGGGGVLLKGNGTITGGAMVGNSAGGYGGAGLCACPDAGTDISVSGVEFAGNAANGTYYSFGGGGISTWHAGTGGVTRITNCKIHGNSASDGGGVVVSAGATAVMSDTVISNNAAASTGGGVCWYDHAAATVTTCRVEYNQAGQGGGIGVQYEASICFSNVVVKANTATGAGGGCAVNFGGKVKFQEGTVSENQGATGGGVYIAIGGELTLDNYLVSDNQAAGSGGGLFLDLAAPLTLRSSAVVNNIAGGCGGGVNCATGLVQNTVISGNNSAGPGGGLYSRSTDGSPIRLRNTVAWGNGASNIAGEWDQYIANGVVANYSCIEGGCTNAGSSNVITNNPRLIDNYHLLSTNSPCYRAGSTNGLPSADINGQSWPNPSTPDIGCDGFLFVDSDNDGMNDEWETYWFGDLSRNGADDADQDGLSNVGEYNVGIDPLEPDTDLDGLPDGWEAQYGLDPNAPNDPNIDSDVDGWTDGQEADQNTDPLHVDTDGDGVEDAMDADPLDPANDDVATPENTCNVTMMVGDSSGSHTELYGMQLGTFRLFMLHVSGSEYIFTKTIRLPRGETYEGYVEALGDSDNDGDFDADVTSEEPGFSTIDPNGVLGGHHEDTGFNSGRRYFQIALGSTAANTNTAANADPENGCTKDPINTQNGNVTLSETDVVIPCPGLSLSFGREYNSRAAITNSILGPCWAHSYELSLQSRSNTMYKGSSGNWRMLSLPQGQEYWFQDNGDGTYKNPPDSNLRLGLAGSGWAITQAGGAQWAFDTNGVLNGVVDAFSNRVTLTYTGAFPNHKLSRVEHLNGQFLDFSYTGAALTRIDTPVNSFSVQFSYNANNELAWAARNVGGASYTNRYLYDGATHCLTQRVNAAGDMFNYGYGYTTNAGQVISRGISMALAPDYYQHTLNYTNRGANATEVTYSRNGTAQTFVYKYDPVINMIKAQLGPGGTNLGVRYSINGSRDISQETQFDDSLGEYAKILRSYDTNHNVTFTGFALNAATTTNWTGFTWNNNLLASVKDAEGARVEFEYTNGLVKAAKAYIDSNNYFATRYTYTGNGLLSAVTNANGHWQGFAYDSYGFMTSSVPQLGPAAQLEYNRLGFATNIVTPWGAGTRAIRVGVNELGWATNVVYPNGLAETFAFDSMGNLTNMVDMAGRTNRLTWLPTGKPASVSRWLDGASPTNVTTAFAYDNQFNTLKITDPMGRAVESYKLDIQDRPLAVTNLEGRVMTINWGLGDYVRSLTRFDGTVVSNSYNAAGLLSRVVGPAFTNSFTYYRNGALKTADNGNSVVANAFDLAGRLTSQQTVGGGQTNIVAYLFDPVGNVTNVAVANTPVQYGWTFDEAERPLSLTAQAASNRVSVFQWNYNTNNGLVASVTNAAITESVGYDILDCATNIMWKTASGTTNRSFGFAFNSAGMITNVSRENGGWTAYTYDSIDRLLSEKQYASTGLTYSASWTYDLAGNRTRSITNSVTNLYSYAAGNILTNFGAGTLVQHDLAGNITNLQYSASLKLSLYWNGRYELTEVKTNGVTAEKYDYDALGRRARIIAGTTTNTFVYSGPHIVAEWSNNVLARSYSHGPGVDNILSMTTYGAATNTYLYLKDAIGSVHALVNTNGVVVEQYRYTAWGEVTVLSSNGTVLAASAYGNRFTFQGREVSYSTGLLFFRSRYYSSSLGRWLSNDPIGISGGLNQYVAFENNPVNRRDPFGTCPDGESFAASYNELLMRNPYWPPYVVNTFLARGDIDIGENRRNTQYRYMGGRLPSDVVGNRVAGQSLISTYGAFAPLLAVIAEGANSLDPTKRGQDKLAAADASIRDNFIGMGKEWAEHPVHTTAITAGSLLVPYLAFPVNWASDRLGR